MSYLLLNKEELQCDQIIQDLDFSIAEPEQSVDFQQQNKVIGRRKSKLFQNSNDNAKIAFREVLNEFKKPKYSYSFIESDSKNADHTPFQPQIVKRQNSVSLLTSQLKSIYEPQQFQGTNDIMKLKLNVGNNKIQNQNSPNQNSSSPQNRSSKFDFAQNKSQINYNFNTPKAYQLRRFCLNYKPVSTEENIVKQISKDMNSSLQIIDQQLKKNFNLMKLIKVQAHVRKRLTQKHYIKLLKKSKYRMSVFNEIVKTEEFYLNDLNIIYREFIVEIKKQNLQSDHEIHKCFLNIAAIIDLNRKMLQAMKQQPWHPNQQIILTISEFAPFFKIYFEYCNNYERMNSLITRFKQDPKFLEFYKQVSKSPELRNLDIEYFLGEPIQRLPKYVLLLKDYLKHTDIDHIDYLNVQQALYLMSKINDANNKNMDKVKLIKDAKMFELQFQFGDINQIKIIDKKRDFLLEEPMTVFWRNLPKSVIVYFLSDMLLITELDQQSGNNNNSMKLLSPFYFTENTFIKDIRDHNNYRYIFSLISKPETITFLCHDHSFKLKITDVLQKITKKFSAISKITQQDPKQTISMEYTPIPTPAPIMKKVMKIEVDVLGSEERVEFLSYYTIYVVQISIELIVCKVFLRFKEFNELQNLTKKLFPFLTLIYSADNNWIGYHGSKIIEARKLQIQQFLQSLLGNPDLYQNFNSSHRKDVQSVLKYLGLQHNFYELPLLLNDFQENCQKDTKSIADQQEPQQMTENAMRNSITVARNSVTSQYKDIQQGININPIKNESTINTNLKQVQRINSNIAQEFQWNLPKPEQISPKETVAQYTGNTPYSTNIGKSLNNAENLIKRQVSAVKLIQQLKQSQIQQTLPTLSVKFNLVVKLCNQSIELIITDNCRALDVADQIATRVGLLQYYDFKFVDEKSGRYVQDDELLINIFRNKEQNSKTNFNLIQKVKDAFQGKYSIFFRKVLYLSSSLEIQECLLDKIRLSLLVDQLMWDIMNLKISLNFKEYCTIAALQLFIIQIETNSKQIPYQLIKTFIPNQLLKVTKKSIWLKQITQQVARCRQQIEAEISNVKNNQEDATNIGIFIVQRVILNYAYQFNLYGMTIFNGENSQDNDFRTKFIPFFLLLGVSIEGIQLFEPTKKILLHTFPSKMIEKIRVFSHYFEIQIRESPEETQIFKFKTTHSYQIYSLHEEYQQVLLELEQAQEVNQ